jgi:hypothetical protein
VPFVNTCATAPVVSIWAAASRTSAPVIRQISYRKAVEEVAKSWRWNS